MWSQGALITGRLGCSPLLNVWQVPRMVGVAGTAVTLLTFPLLHVMGSSLLPLMQTVRTLGTLGVWNSLSALHSVRGM